MIVFMLFPQIMTRTRFIQFVRNASSCEKQTVVLNLKKEFLAYDIFVVVERFHSKFKIAQRYDSLRMKSNPSSQ